MERLKEFETTPTCMLINMLSDAEQKDEQEIVNICAYELACRVYVPNKQITFTQMLKDFGYKSLTLEQEEQNDQLQQSLSTENSKQQIEKWGENSIAESEVKRAVRSMKPDDWGMVRGDLVDRIIAANAQIIDTARPLKEFIATAHSAKMRSSLTRPNRFFPDQIGIVPGRKHSQRHKICLLGDKSGSMGEHELMLVATCINQYIKADCIVEFAWWDVVCEKPKPGLRMQPEFNVSEGGGGTNPACIMKMLAKEKLSYDGLIILTDCKFVWERPKGYDNKIFIIGTPTCTKPPEWCKNRFMTMKDVELSLSAKNLV